MKTALADALSERGYDKLTPVQEAVLAPELESRDLLVSAQTGSGKTVGFGLAIAPILLGEQEVFGPASGPLALVIAPTRELALQVKRELGWLYAKAGVVMASTVGGMEMRQERRALDRGAHIVVATPGRLRDHLTRGTIDLSDLQAVVLDEADEMLDLGFREDLEFILGAAPEDRLTLLFSATVSKPIAQLAQRYQQDAERLVVAAETEQHADIEYKAMMVADRDTENAVINTLRFFEAPNAIVFANTRAMVNRLTTRLSNRGFQVVALSGELSQTERTHALQAMRDGRAQVCVATDVAARGIDLPNLDLVVHAELPNSHDTLLHRSGRTGRAGRKGVSAMIVTKKTRRSAERALSRAKLTAEWTTPPSADAIHAKDQERFLEDPIWSEPTAERDQQVIDGLTSQFTAQDLAAACLRLYRAQRSAPEELLDVEAASAPRAAFGPSIWFSIAGGRKAQADPRRLLPTLCKAGDISRDDIGAIRVQPEVTYFQILETSVPGFVAAVGAGMNIEGAAVEQLKDAPVLVHSPRPDRPPRDDRKGKPRKGPRDRDAGPRDRPNNNESSDKPKYKTAPKRGNDSAKTADFRSEPLDKSKRDHEGAVTKPRKPRHKANDTRPAGPKGGDARPKRNASAEPNKGPAKERGGKPKGPPPPKGKASSKKNRARIAAAKTAAKAASKKKPS